MLAHEGAALHVYRCVADAYLLADVLRRPWRMASKQVMLIPQRDGRRHARTGHLQADAYPRITVDVDRRLAAQPAGAEEALFTGHGTLSLIGRTHPIAITGTLKKADPATLERLHLTATILLLVRATFSIAIKDTALASRAHSFDADVIPISVSLVLRHTYGMSVK